MNQVRIFADFDRYSLEKDINKFGETNEIVSVSLTTNRDHYCACVVYKEEGGTSD